MQQSLARIGHRAAAANRRAYEHSPLDFLMAAQRRHGDLFRFDDTVTVALHPEAVHHILHSTGRELALGGAGSPWSRVPAGARTTFRTTTAVRAAPAIAAEFRATLDGCAGRPVDVFDTWIGACGRSLAGYCAGADAQARAVADLEAAVAEETATGFRRRWATRRRRRTTRAELWSAMAAASAGPPAAGAPVEAFATAVARRCPMMSRDDRSRLLGPVLTGAMVSPAATLAWSAFELARRPGERDLLRAEIARAGLDEILRSPLRPDRRVLAFVKEILRHYCPPWMAEREVVRPWTLAGTTFAAGERLAFSPYVLHHDPRWWDRPDRFLPQRWITGRRPHAKYAYRPFGGGARTCPGASFGLVQAVTGVAVALHHFDFEPDHEVRPQVHPAGVLAPYRASGAWRPRRTGPDQ